MWPTLDFTVKASRTDHHAQTHYSEVKRDVTEVNKTSVNMEAAYVSP